VKEQLVWGHWLAWSVWKPCQLKSLKMINIILYRVIAGLLSILIIISGLLRLKSDQNKEKNRPFECGFDPIGDTRIRFCMKFFLVGVIFLIFDVEITLILPLPFRQTFIIIFLIILLIGLVYEWYYGGLDWLI